jgi:hypothetical protein
VSRTSLVNGIGGGREEVVEENELDDDCAKYGQPSEFKT